MNNGIFTKRVALAIASLATVAAVGWTGAMMLNGKADAAAVEAVEDRMDTLTQEYAVQNARYQEIIRRLDRIEKKLEP